MEIKKYKCNLCGAYYIEVDVEGKPKCLILDDIPEAHICFDCETALGRYFK